MILKLFGPLRQYGEITLDVSAPLCVRDAREALKLKLPGAPIVEQCAFADDERVLKDSDLLQPLARYSVLPPVAGG